nr:hypothetical protein [Candidatus Sigynarchaeota archaeon]
MMPPIISCSPSNDRGSAGSICDVSPDSSTTDPGTACSGTFLATISTVWSQLNPRAITTRSSAAAGSMPSARASEAMSCGSAALSNSP